MELFYCHMLSHWALTTPYSFTIEISTGSTIIKNYCHYLWSTWFTPPPGTIKEAKCPLAYKYCTSFLVPFQWKREKNNGMCREIFLFSSWSILQSTWRRLKSLQKRAITDWLVNTIKVYADIYHKTKKQKKTKKKQKKKTTKTNQIQGQRLQSLWQGAIHLTCQVGQPNRYKYLLPYGPLSWLIHLSRKQWHWSGPALRTLFPDIRAAYLWAYLQLKKTFRNNFIIHKIKPPISFICSNVKTSF